MARTGYPVVLAAQVAALGLAVACVAIVVLPVTGIWLAAARARRTLRAVWHVLRHDRSARATVEAIGLAFVAAGIFYICACAFLLMEPLS